MDVDIDRKDKIRTRQHGKPRGGRRVKNSPTPHNPLNATLVKKSLKILCKNGLS
jgi:hypothetical protein